MKYALIASLSIFLVSCSGSEENTVVEGTEEVYEFYDDGTVKSIGNFKDGKHPKKQVPFQLYELCTSDEFMPALDSMKIASLVHHVFPDEVGWCMEETKKQVDKSISEWKDTFPHILFLWSKPEKIPGGTQYELLALRIPDANAQVINSNDITRVSNGLDQGSGQITIDITLTEDGAGELETISSRNLGKRMAIVSNGTVMSTPNMVNVITGGTVQITGNFTQDEAEKMKRAIDPYILNGERRSYHPNGKLKEIRLYKDGESTGQWSKYDEHGELTKQFGKR